MNLDCKRLDSVPTAVSLQCRGKRAAKVAFTPTAPSGAAETGSFTSAPFEDSGEIGGILSATLSGKPLSVTVSVR
jgi:hypothetical protein